MVVWVKSFRQLGKAWWWGLFAMTVLMGPVGFGTAWYLLRQPAVMVMGVSEDDGVAVRGRDLEFIATKIDNSVCRTSVARWLWRFDPFDPLPSSDPHKRKQWRELTSTPHSPPEIGRLTTYRLSVPIPDYIETGDWHYLGVAIDTCGDITHAAPRFSRDIPIHIDAAINNRDVVGENP